jgi:hypothetical protein
MTRSEVSVVIPTRGDVDLGPILDTLTGFYQVIVWDNSDPDREDLGLYARYAAIEEAGTQVIVTQDDDLIVTGWDRLLDEYEPDVLTVNYPQPWNIPWVARGAVFDRHLPEMAFQRWDSMFERDRDFTHWMCDGVFGLLTDSVRDVDYGSTDLPYCNDSHRISSQIGDWYNDKRPAIVDRCNEVKARG